MKLVTRISMPLNKHLKSMSRYEVIDDDGLRLAIIFADPGKYKKVSDIIAKIVIKEIL